VLFLSYSKGIIARVKTLKKEERKRKEANGKKKKNMNTKR